ncbi:MAG: 4'-phosphopantetheinyl transferase superfamily protein [Alphaproteobacteria bacterium]|nr:4'-phosphopantetheinyl transferase superfamily protein [Alphaproteobacteria bacterium]
MYFFIFNSYREVDSNFLREKIIKHALKNYFGIDCEFSIIKSLYGQPRILLSNNKTIYLSISHSENHTAYAIAKKPIGIDIQRLKKLEFKSIEKLFCFTELSIWKKMEQEFEINKKYFYSVLSIKEAILKGEGFGFIGDPKKINTSECINFNKKGISKINGNIIIFNKSWKIYQNINDDVVYTVAIQI